MKILNYGSLNLDHCYRLEHLIRPGETLSSCEYLCSEGGKGLNQAIALARAGADVYMAGAVGQDGIFLKELLEHEGVDTQYVRVLEEPTGHAIIQVDEAGRNAIFIYGGANRQNTTAVIENVLSHFAPGNALLLQNEINMGGEILHAAADRGLTVILNPSPISEELLAWPLDRVRWMLLNEVEGRELSGEADPEKILDALCARWPTCRFVLTLGRQGAWYADVQKRFHQPAMRVEAVDTTAAGDTFTGYFLSAVLSNHSERESLLRATVAASIAVRHLGAVRSIPRSDEVDALMEACK